MQFLLFEQKKRIEFPGNVLVFFRLYVIETFLIIYTIFRSLFRFIIDYYYSRL